MKRVEKTLENGEIMCLGEVWNNEKKFKFFVAINLLQLLNRQLQF